MGIFFAKKKPPSRVTEHDKAVLVNTRFTRIPNLQNFAKCISVFFVDINYFTVVNCSN